MAKITLPETDKLKAFFSIEGSNSCHVFPLEPGRAACPVKGGKAVAKQGIEFCVGIRGIVTPIHHVIVFNINRQ